MHFKRRFWPFVGLWVIGAFAVALLLGSLNWLDYYRLTRSGVETVGQITRKEPNNHLAVYYAYEVGSKTYSGQGNAPSPQSLDGLKVGDNITVHYVNEAPQLSCWGDPQKLLANETTTVLLGSLVVSTVLTALFYYRFSRTRWFGTANLTLLAITLAAFSTCSTQADRRTAETAVRVFHARLDADKYHEIYGDADDQFRSAGTEDEITRFLAKVHQSLGALRHSELKQSKVGYIQGLGAQVILVYDSDFEKGQGIEQFLWQIREGKAMLVRYDINSSALKKD